MLKIYQECRQLLQAHLPGSDIRDNPTPIEHDKPVSKLMNMREIVLDVDAGPTRGFY
jgi:hypothetical protein